MNKRDRERKQKEFRLTFLFEVCKLCAFWLFRATIRQVMLKCSLTHPHAYDKASKKKKKRRKKRKEKERTNHVYLVCAVGNTPLIQNLFVLICSLVGGRGDVCHDIK